MTLNFFYYSTQTKVLRNERNLIESFKLPRILNSLKFPNYLIQTHSPLISRDMSILLLFMLEFSIHTINGTKN